MRVVLKRRPRRSGGCDDPRAAALASAGRAGDDHPVLILPQRTHAAGKSHHGCALTRSRFVGADAVLLERSSEENMTIVSVSEGNLIVEVEGWDKLWSLRSRLVIPIQHVTGICEDAKIAEGWWHGMRVAGAQVPGVITAGTFYHHGNCIFWDVHHPEKVIVVDLEDERYEKLIIEVADPSEAVVRLREALRSASS